MRFYEGHNGLGDPDKQSEANVAIDGLTMAGQPRTDTMPSVNPVRVKLSPRGVANLWSVALSCILL